VQRRTADTLDVEFICSAQVRTSGDSVVWSSDGFRTRLDPETGTDLDGDGRAEAVVGVDSGGGNRGFWTYTVLRFLPLLQVAAELKYTPFFSRDEGGRILIQELIPFYGLGPDMADSPVLVLVHQFRDGRLVDVTAERCPHILGDTVMTPGSPYNLSQERALATPANLAASRESAGKASYEVEQTRVAVMSLVLQHLVCARDEEAARLVNATWPPAEAPEQLPALRKQVESVIRTPR
jgi:hypothetical protein